MLRYIAGLFQACIGMGGVYFQFRHCHWHFFMLHRSMKCGKNICAARQGALLHNRKLPPRAAQCYR
jgi:hypothetical protein